MDNDDVLLVLGQIIGLASRISVAEAERAAESSGLTPHNRTLLREAARFRRAIAAVLGKG